jgi:hypothetical protein
VCIQRTNENGKGIIRTIGVFRVLESAKKRVMESFNVMGRMATPMDIESPLVISTRSPSPKNAKANESGGRNPLDR